MTMAPAASDQALCYFDHPGKEPVLPPIGHDAVEDILSRATRATAH